MNTTAFQQNLLAWFDQYGRKDLPWQLQKTPYRVWVSEIMLQQTQVVTVIPYFERFIARYPTLADLAESPLDDVLTLWSGLGYYSRARNLHKAAQIIQQEFGGNFSHRIDDLVKLPGIGRSTAGAILSLACRQQHAILDGNVKRVLCRYFTVDGWPGKTDIERQLWQYAEQLTPNERCGDFNQAMMDLGSGVCTRSKPQCPSCPLKQDCLAFQANMTGFYPHSKPKKALPNKQRLFLIATTPDEQVLLEKCAATGLWGGLWTLPQLETEQDIADWLMKYQLTQTGDLIHWLPFTHTFSHFQLRIQPVRIPVKPSSAISDHTQWRWFQTGSEIDLAVPTPVRNILLALSET